jgi:hypothetical protein
MTITKGGIARKTIASSIREMCMNPKDKEEELLLAYKIQYGKLPICNERIG